MSFIGIIAENATYEFIKKEILKKENIKLIRIKKRDIENIKNIKFETVIICEEIKKIGYKKKFLDKIIDNTNYLVINSDINIQSNIFLNKKLNIITYGLNQKATVTASSISEDNVMVCLQRNIKNKDGEIIEVQETRINEKNINNKKVYSILVSYIISQMY